MSFKILFMFALFGPLLVIAAGTLLHGPKPTKPKTELLHDDGRAASSHFTDSIPRQPG